MHLTNYAVSACGIHQPCANSCGQMAVRSKRPRSSASIGTKGIWYDQEIEGWEPSLGCLIPKNLIHQNDSFKVLNIFKRLFSTEGFFLLSCQWDFGAPNGDGSPEHWHSYGPIPWAKSNSQGRRFQSLSAPNAMAVTRMARATWWIIMTESV